MCASPYAAPSSTARRQLGRSGIRAQAVELAGQPALPARRALAIEVGQEQHSARAGRHARRQLEQRRPGPGRSRWPASRAKRRERRPVRRSCCTLARGSPSASAGRAVGTAHRHDQAPGTPAGVTAAAELIEPGGPERQQRIRRAGNQRSTPRHPPRPVGRPDRRSRSSPYRRAPPARVAGHLPCARGAPMLASIQSHSWLTSPPGCSDSSSRHWATCWAAMPPSMPSA